jgi:hypothetical protein
MMYESGSVWETPPTTGLPQTNSDSPHTRSRPCARRVLLRRYTGSVTQTRIVPHSFRIPTISTNEKAKALTCKVRARLGKCYE